MYSYGHLVKFHLNTPSFFMKDDHDTLKNDCWAGQTYGDLTWNQGLRIFREQNPMGEKTYRTRRWGKDVQFWLTENRDFRSPNNMTDGPEKTIYGPRQKKWLKETMADSDAAFRFLISPGCIIGPDKRGKSDNHANKVFQSEGDEMRQFLAPMRDNTFVICGDRHWQYHSLHPELKINEFGCGPIGDKHTYGGNCGRQPAIHQYFDRGGGFLLVTVERKKGVPQATFQYYAAHDKEPKTGQWTIRYEKTFTARTTEK